MTKIPDNCRWIVAALGEEECLSVAYKTREAAYSAVLKLSDEMPETEIAMMQLDLVCYKVKQADKVVYTELRRHSRYLKDAK